MTDPAQHTLPPAGVSNPAVRLGGYKMLEAWRGMASVWVVLYHMSLINAARYPALESFALYRFAGQGYLGVYIFFVISGYCIANAACRLLGKDNRVGQYAYARARRILPPVWAALAFTTLLSVVAAWVAAHGHTQSAMGHDNVLHRTVWFYAANMTLTQFVFHQPLFIIVAWTLCYEAAFYAIVGVGLAFAPTLAQERRLLNILHGVTVASLAVLALLPKMRGYPFDLWPAFGFGVVVFDIVTHPRSRVPWYWLGGIVGATLAFAAWRDIAVGPFGHSSRLILLFSLGAAMVLLVLHRYDEAWSRRRPVQAIASVGLFSYSLYLIHYPCLGVVNQGMKMMNIPFGFHYVALAGGVAISMVAARVFYQFFERPFLKKARRHLPAAPETVAGVKDI